MNMGRYWAAVVAGLLIGGQVWGAELDLSGCAFPDAPELPDVDSASVEEIGTTGAAVRAYVNTMQSQLECLNGAADALGVEITPDQRAMITSAYNAGVDTLNEVADAYNQTLRAYKARTE